MKPIKEVFEKNLSTEAKLLKDSVKIKKIIDSYFEEVGRIDRYTAGSLVEKIIKEIQEIVDKEIERLKGSLQTLNDNSVKMIDEIRNEKIQLRQENNQLKQQLKDVNIAWKSYFDKSQRLENQLKEQRKKIEDCIKKLPSKTTDEIITELNDIGLKFEEEEGKSLDNMCKLAQKEYVIESHKFGITEWIKKEELKNLLDLSEKPIKDTDVKSTSPEKSENKSGKKVGDDKDG